MEDYEKKEDSNCKIVNKVTGKEYFFKAGEGRNDPFNMFRDIIKDLYNNNHLNTDLQQDFLKYGYSNLVFSLDEIPESIKGKKFFKLF